MSQSPGVLVIDDVDASLGQMSELGRRLFTPFFKDAQTAIMAVASRHNWDQVNHATFSRWVVDCVAQKERGEVALLDPLISLPSGSQTSVRYSRRVDRLGSILRLQYAGEIPLLPGNCSTIVDDAAVTGGTLHRFVESCKAQGRTITEIVVCAASDSARARLRLTGAAVTWTTFIPGSWKVIHLRDVFPFLPYAGRLTATQENVGSRPIEIRRLMESGDSPLWTIFLANHATSRAVRSLRSAAIDAFDRHLGRPAMVDDLPLLGVHTPAHRQAQITMSSFTTLRALLGEGS